MFMLLMLWLLVAIVMVWDLLVLLANTLLTPYTVFCFCFGFEYFRLLNVFVCENILSKEKLKLRDKTRESLLILQAKRNLIYLREDS